MNTAVDIAVDIAVDNFVDRSSRGMYHEEMWRTPTQLGIGSTYHRLPAAVFVFHVKHWQPPFRPVFTMESDVNS